MVRAMQLQKLLTIPHARYGRYLIRNITIKYKKVLIVTREPLQNLDNGGCLKAVERT